MLPSTNALEIIIKELRLITKLKRFHGPIFQEMGVLPYIGP